ncbi:MAG TPA: hypothetical protein VD769_00925 [Gaiellaceae bacterium]|nr:hypothetical protein [Gaiellaceae bacterium]
MGGLVRQVVLTLVASLALAAPAAAGSFADSAAPCEGRTAEQPFKRWLDPMRYVLAPNGNLESGATGWRLTGGAKVVAGNETFYVGGAGDSRSLYLPTGSSATTRAMCVQLLHPTVRYFARNRATPVLSSLRVEALVENPLTGGVLVLPVGVHTGPRAWHPSLPGLVLADFLSVLGDDGELAVAFRFKPLGLGAAWQIDDVYVDPFRNR